MTIVELGRTAYREIAAHKARSAMTCFSLAIGVAAMLFTFSQTGGMMKRYRDRVDLYGPGRFTISPKQGYQSKGLSAGLTMDDAREIRNNWPEFFMVNPRFDKRNARMRSGRFSSDKIRVLGVTEDWRKREWVYSLRGRFLNAQDDSSASRVCVLVQGGGWIEKPFWARWFPELPLTSLLKKRDLLGSRILLSERVYTVIGVIKEPPKDRDLRMGHSSYGEDGTIIIPATTFERYLDESGKGQIAEMSIDTGDGRATAAAMRSVGALLRRRHRGEEDFEIRDFREVMQGALKRMKEFINSIMAIGIVAVLASGIGIMNVTLATIFSRVREIGVRRSLGATRADIVWQFVAESTALGIVGGAAGTALGTVAIALLAPREDRMLEIGAIHVLGSLAIAVGTGFLFSLYPAYKASRFDPIEALRYE